MIALTYAPTCNKEIADKVAALYDRAKKNKLTIFSTTSKDAIVLIKNSGSDKSRSDQSHAYAKRCIQEVLPACEARICEKKVNLEMTIKSKKTTPQKKETNKLVCRVIPLMAFIGQIAFRVT